MLQCLLVFISLHHGSPVGLVFQILHPQVSKSSLLLAKSAKCLFLHQLFMAWPVSETEEVWHLHHLWAPRVGESSSKSTKRLESKASEDESKSYLRTTILFSPIEKCDFNQRFVFCSSITWDQLQELLLSPSNARQECVIGKSYDWVCHNHLKQP